MGHSWIERKIGSILCLWTPGSLPHLGLMEAGFPSLAFPVCVAGVITVTGRSTNYRMVKLTLPCLWFSDM